MKIMKSFFEMRMYLILLYMAMGACNKSEYGRDKIQLKYNVDIENKKVDFEYYNDTKEDFLMFIPKKKEVIPRKTFDYEKEALDRGQSGHSSDDLMNDAKPTLVIEKEEDNSTYSQMLYRVYQEEFKFQDTAFIQEMLPTIVLIKSKERRKISYKIENSNLLKIGEEYTYPFHKMRYRLNNSMELKLLHKFVYNIENKTNYKVLMEDVFVKDSIKIERK
jgi:lipoprotein